MCRAHSLHKGHFSGSRRCAVCTTAPPVSNTLQCPLHSAVWLCILICRDRLCESIDFAHWLTDFQRRLDTLEYCHEQRIADAHTFCE